jgi:hypothetical protein
VEQHLPAADREWQVTQLVEDDEIEADELIGEAPGFSGTRFGLELIDQVDCGEEPERARRCARNWRRSLSIHGSCRCRCRRSARHCAG